MRTVPANLAAHLEESATTTCHCWRLTRRDGLVLGFTEHDGDLEFAGTVFTAGSGFQASEVESGLGLAADAADILGAFAAEAISKEDIAAGRYDGALVETFLVNWQAPTDHMLLSTREVGEVRSGPDAFHAELRSLAARLDRPMGRIYARSCDADLGDHRCMVDLDDPAFTATASVTAAESAGVFATTGLGGFAPGWFRQGHIEFTGGPLAGLSFQVAEHAVDGGTATLTLWSPAERAAEPGDGFVIRAGCDKRRETCRDKFSNILNFRGFPFMPGSDFAYGYADEDTVHDGRPLVL